MCVYFSYLCSHSNHQEQNSCLFKKNIFFAFCVDFCVIGIIKTEYKFCKFLTYQSKLFNLQYFDFPLLV